MSNLSPSALANTRPTAEKGQSLALETLSLHRPSRFDPDNKRHRQKLLLWCEECWSKDFKTAIQAGNSPIYHDCCTCFTRRAFCRTAGHPDLQSSAVSKIPAFKEMEKPEDLYRWLLKTLQANKRRGDRCLFPRFNVQHQDDDGVDNLDSDSTITELRNTITDLRKRAHVLEDKVKKLTLENNQLLHASKTWYQRYQEVTENSDKKQPTLFDTPMKKNNSNNFSLLENY